MGLHPAERVREYREKGYWTDDTIDALFRARVAEFGDIPAVVDPLNRDTLTDGPARTLTWTQVDDEVSRLAQVLLDEGVSAGDAVGVQLPNTVEIVVAFLAVVRIGAIVVPFPVQYRAYELTTLSNVAGVTAFITAGRIGKRAAAAEMTELRGQIPSLRTLAVFGPDVPPGAVPLDSRVAGAADRGGLAAHLAAVKTDPNDCVTICWTSGTESTPKGVQRTHYDWLAMSTATVEGPRLTAGDVLLNPFPMVNMAGINGMFLPWLRVGGLLVQHHPFDLPTFLRQIGQYRATYTVAPPALLTALLHNDALLAAGRHLVAAGARFRLGAARAQPAAGLARQVRPGDTQLLRLERGRVAARHPAGHPRPGGAGAVLPALRGAEQALVVLHRPLDAGADRGPGDRQGDHRGGSARRAADQGARGVPRLPAGQRRARPVRARRLPQDRRHPGDRRRRARVPALRGPVQGHGGQGRHEDLGRRDRDAGLRPPEGGGRRRRRLPRRTARRADLRHRRLPARPPVTLAEIVDYLRGIGVATFKLPERLELRDELPRNPVGKILKRDLREELRGGAA